MRIGELGEFGLIGWETASLVCRDPDLRVGVGDDAAVFEAPPGQIMVATTDMLVEGVHFRLDWTDPRRLGWKAIAVNLSDIAAMGALPGSVLVSIALPKETEVSFVDALYAGMEDALKRFNACIAGGDTVSSLSGIVLNIAMLGRADRRQLALRKGAQPGDKILVTGTLGDSAAGLALLQAGHRPSPELPQNPTGIPWLLERHLSPYPRIAEAQAAVKTGAVKAMMDISDGIAGDIRHIGARSGVGALLMEDLLPISDASREAAQLFNADPVEWALSGGEDYELLLVTGPNDTNNVIAAIYEATGTPATVVGEIRETGLTIASPDEGERELGETGYHHF